MSEERLTRIEAKVDKMNDRLSSIDSTLSAQHIVLTEHTKRSTQLEARVEPLEQHDAEFVGAIKFIKFVGILAGLAEIVSQVFRHWK